MNTGAQLKYAIELMPEYFSEGRANPYLHILGIPVDELASEPIVIEITW